MLLFPEGRPTTRETIEAYRRSGGYLALEKIVGSPPMELIGEIEASGLRGRGGAGFPAARKWSITAGSAEKTRYLVANAGEDEPGSFKDRALLDYRPHLVLEGMILASYAIGAETAYLYLNETYPECRERFTRAIGEAEAAGFAGEGILGTDFSLTIKIVNAPTVYVAGEDSASLEVIEGKPPQPRQKPPYPAESGLFRKPTVVNNVETLAHVPGIVRNGAGAFRQLGTPNAPGTMLFCLGKEVNRPGVYELPIGSSIRHLLENRGCGLQNGACVKAVSTGPSSAFLTGDQLDLPLEPDALKSAGSMLGCGVMRFYPAGTCMVEATLGLAQFFARESCGQCPACRMETSMLATILERVQKGEGPLGMLGNFERVIEFNKGKGNCALINMPGPPILSAIRLFPEDFHAHLRTGVCSSSL